MIRRTIECEWPGCSQRATEAGDGEGWPGWGHVRGFRLDGAARDLHLCPEHLRALGTFILEVKDDGLDRP